MVIAVRNGCSSISKAVIPVGFLYRVRSKNEKVKKVEAFEFLAINTKFTMLSMFAYKAFSSSKEVTSAVARSGDHWFNGLIVKLLN